MTNGACYLEIHQPLVGHGSRIGRYVGLTGAEAAALMEQYADKALRLLVLGQPTQADLEALDQYQNRNGKRLVNQWAPTDGAV